MNLVQNNSDLLSPEYKAMLDKINTFIDDANSSSLLKCGPDCQKNKKDEQLYNEYLSKKNNMVNAEKQFTNAEKNYMISTKGEKYYDDFILEKYQKQASDIVSELNDELLYNVSLVNEKIKRLNILEKSVTNSGELSSDYIEKVSDLRDTINAKENAKNIANRKSYYNSQKNLMWENIEYYLEILFWFVFIAFAVMAILKKRYSDKTIIIYSTTLLLFYFIKMSSIISFFTQI